MNINDTRIKLKNIIDGVIIEGATDNCTTTRNILCSSFSTSTTVKRDFESKSISKKEQVEFLKIYASEKDLLLSKPQANPNFLLEEVKQKFILNQKLKVSLKLMTEFIMLPGWSSLTA